MKLFTIGFAGKSAEKFFELLGSAGVVRIIDTRRHNKSQLAGFTKGQDLKYFLQKIANIQYSHVIDYAPTAELLKEYRTKKINWDEYEKKYRDLILTKNLSNKIKWDEIDKACLLCSEEFPEKCHRRVLAEYFKTLRPDIEICHI